MQSPVAARHIPTPFAPPLEAVPPFAEGYPELMALWRFWRAQAGSRRMPARADLDTVALKPWLGHLLLIDVHSPKRLHFRVFGTRVAHLLGSDAQNRSVADLPQANRDDMQRDCETMLRDRAPRFAERRCTFACLRGFAPRDGRLGTLQLPLSEDGERVSQILVAVYPRAE